MPEIGQMHSSTNRPPASKSWRVVHRWGSQLGDVRELTVVRITEGQMTISYGKEAIAIREELVPILAEMVAEAAAWKDDPNE